eukprot:scaffold1504_cov111-Isochrysis_galbana.AAC.1
MPCSKLAPPCCRSVPICTGHPCRARARGGEEGRRRPWLRGIGQTLLTQHEHIFRPALPALGGTIRMRTTIAGSPNWEGTGKIFCLREGWRWVAGGVAGAAGAGGDGLLVVLCAAQRATCGALAENAVWPRTSCIAADTLQPATSRAGKAHPTGFALHLRILTLSKFTASQRQPADVRMLASRKEEGLAAAGMRPS